MLDRRCRYKYREVQEFFLFIRNKRNHIYYVRFRGGATVSTGETELKKAYQFALDRLKTAGRRSRASDFRSILEGYYTPGSAWTSYDEKHGTRYTERTLQFNRHRMKIAAGLLDDVKRPENLTRQRLLAFQEQLLERGLSGKTVNNYIAIMHKIFRQLLDKELIDSDPFRDLKPCAFSKELRLCFPLERIRGAFRSCRNKHELLAFVACATGMRRGEIGRIEAGDVSEKNGRRWLKVRGTKSAYSAREVPVFPLLESAVEQVRREAFSCHDWKRSVAAVGEKIGFGADYIEENGIKFHSFRKLYKTLLTQANLNTSLVETFMGHSTQNQMSNNVERIYFVAESADLSAAHDSVCAALQYLV